MSVLEDGELPSLTPVAAVVNNINLLTPHKGSDIEHSRRLSLITKSVVSPMSKGKSPSFKKHEEDLDLMVVSDSELDESAQIEVETEKSPGVGVMVDNSWIDCGIQDFRLLLTRKLASVGDEYKLEAKVDVLLCSSIF